MDSAPEMSGGLLLHRGSKVGQRPYLRALVLNTGIGLVCKLFARRARCQCDDVKEYVVKLTTKGRYAVMAMADLARHSSGNPVALAEIAERQEISLSYLEQLFAKLRRGNLVKSVRGPGGGYLLAREADNIRISDVILAVDEPIKATRCELGSPKGCLASSGRCITHDLWEGLSQQIHVFLNSVSLGDVIDGRLAGGAMAARGDAAGRAEKPAIVAAD